MLALSPTLLEDEPDLPEVDTPQARTRLTAVAELLDAVAASSFDREIAVAFRRCLLAVWDKEPEVVLDAATAAHVAGGVAWVVAKANGVLGAQGRVTVTQLKHALALHPSPSTYGKVVQRALVGYRDFEAQRTGRVYELPGPAAARPDGSPARRHPQDPVPRPRPGARGAGSHGGVSSTVEGRIPGMPTLNIKDPEVYELASELARRRDTSMTGAVRDALTEALERTRLTPEEKVRRMTEIARRSAGHRRHRSSPTTTSTTSGACRSDRRLVRAGRDHERTSRKQDEFKATLARHRHEGLGGRPPSRRPSCSGRVATTSLDELLRRR